MASASSQRLFPLRSWLNNALVPRPVGHSILTFAIGATAFCAITTLFFLFLFVSLFDDIVRVVGPDRVWGLAKTDWMALDWTLVVDKLSKQLTNLAEWEKQKRTAWYPDDHPSHQDDDRFHELIYTVTAYLNDYVRTRHSKQRQKQH
ncbi:hypothetical protein DFQ28_009962 [Apophysomyces sp. BC1034]|nr:hypothetical protein DFQ30_002610 [Apophysomyces sp. BC1015]KAG0174144.1 hypothetical protein DFQ29_007587 [Apophysomyces sp. BC1021]KAG0185095.1 hypothetical protein DFQ28_009962 [Apophysomyces sp. BC1034]